MPLQFKNLSADKTRLVFVDKPTVEPDDDILMNEIAMPLANALRTIDIWAASCRGIDALQEKPKPAKPARISGSTRAAHGELCKAYRAECEEIEAANYSLRDKKGVDFIDKLMSGFALYEGLTVYADATGTSLPPSKGMDYFRQELEAAAIEAESKAAPKAPAAKKQQLQAGAPKR